MPGANCWRLASVNSYFLATIKKILTTANFRIPGMCCYYKGNYKTAIMFGKLERVSDTQLNLFAISHAKKTFVCTVKNIEDRAYISIENNVLSVPSVHGLIEDEKIKNRNLICETATRPNKKWLTEKAELIQTHMSHRGLCYLYNRLQ